MRIFFFVMAALLSFWISEVSQVSASTDDAHCEGSESVYLEQFGEVEGLDSQAALILERIHSEQSTASCFGDLTQTDVQTLLALRNDLESYYLSQPSAPSVDQKREAFRLLMEKYGPRLSDPARKFLIADYLKQNITGFISNLRNNPKLSQSFLQLNDQMDDLIKNSRRFGAWGTNDKGNELIKRTNEFLSEVDSLSMDPELKKGFRRNILTAVQTTFSQSSDQLKGMDQKLAVGQFAAGTVLVGSLTVASVLTYGAATPAAAAASTATASAFGSASYGAVAGWVTSAAVTATASAAGGAAGVGMYEGLRLIGNSALNGEPDVGFFCNLAGQYSKNSGRILDQMLFGAVMGGSVGGGMGLIGGTFGAMAKMGLGVSLMGMGGLSAIREGSEAYALYEKAVEAMEQGNEYEARKYLEQAKRKSVDVAAESISQILGGGGLLKVAGKGNAHSFKEALLSGWKLINPSQSSVKTWSYSISRASHLRGRYKMTKGVGIHINEQGHTALMVNGKEYHGRVLGFGTETFRRNTAVSKGVLAKIENLPPEVTQHLDQQLQKGLQGGGGALTLTCARGTCDRLSDAGLIIGQGSRPVTSSQLLEELMQNRVLSPDGTPIKVTLVPIELDSVDSAKKLIRAGERNTAMQVAGVAVYATSLTTGATVLYNYIHNTASP